MARSPSRTEMEGVEGFRHEDFGLAAVRCEEWFNLIFVNLDPQAAPLVQALGDLPKQAERFDFGSMKFFERRTYEMKCNWKTYVDNYLEGFHLPTVHPGLNRELDFNAYMVEPYQRHVRQFSPIRGAQPGDATPRRYQEVDEDLTADYFWAFPNWMINCYPDNVSVNMIVPQDTEHTLGIFEFYLPEKDLNSPAARASVEFSDQVQLRRRRHLRGGAKEFAFAQLPARPLQRPSGKGRARFSPNVCRCDERLKKSLSPRPSFDSPPVGGSRRRVAKPLHIA